MESPQSDLPVLKNLWAGEAAPNAGRPFCTCLDAQDDNGEWAELTIHQESQDTECAGWKKLLALIDEAANDKRELFSPGRDMPPEQWAQITTLPATIAKLKSVKHFILYGSSFVRIPPEIGEMSSLEEFTPYTSYRLHWFPFEILRCKNLKESTISTRALYGNNKYRPPFPRLPQLSEAYSPLKCSLCGTPLGSYSPIQVWVSLLVATDVVPLLVHACSEQCIQKIPQPPEGYVQTPHEGGLGLVQPKGRYL